MSESSENEEITALDRHIPAPPADGATSAEATTEPAEDATGEAAAESTPIKPLDRHIP